MAMHIEDRKFYMLQNKVLKDEAKKAILDQECVLRIKRSNLFS